MASKSSYGVWHDDSAAYAGWSSRLHDGVRKFSLADAQASARSHSVGNKFHLTRVVELKTGTDVALYLDGKRYYRG